MAATAEPLLAKPTPTKSYVAKITSKGQITIPLEIRRLLGAKPGDKLTFQPTNEGINIVCKPEENAFEKMRGIGNWLPEGYHGREGIIRYFRELRGHDEYDDLVQGNEE